MQAGDWKVFKVSRSRRLTAPASRPRSPWGKGSGPHLPAVCLNLNLVGFMFKHSSVPDRWVTAGQVFLLLQTLVFFKSRRIKQKMTWVHSGSKILECPSSFIHFISNQMSLKHCLSAGNTGTSEGQPLGPRARASTCADPLAWLDQRRFVLS